MFTLIRGGCFSKHSSSFTMKRPDGLPYYVLLLIKSPGEFEVNGIRMQAKPNSALLIKPNTPYSYQNPDGAYADDWLHFECNEATSAFLPEKLFHTIIPVSNTRLLTGYLQQLLWENNFCTTDSKDYYVDTLFQLLLKHIHDDFNAARPEDYHPYKYKLQRIRLEIQSAPDKKYSARELAERLEISTSYFQTLYKHFFQTAFQADVIHLRIDYAKELLISTMLPVEQIACSCGYSNEVHFHRQFLAKTGMTPGEYRQTYFSPA